MSTSSQFVPVVKSELDFFRPRSVQTSQVGYETIALKPINSVSPSSRRIEFFHPGKGSDFFRKLSHTYFYLKFAVTKTDGTKVTDDKYSIINYFGQTIINSIEVQLNGVSITRNADNYAYRAFIETLLSSNKLDAECHLASSGFSVDVGSNVHEFDSENTAQSHLGTLIKNANQVEFISRLHGDLFNSHLYLPNGLDLTINLNLNSDAFLLLKDKAETATNAQIRLVDCTLFTEICHINPAVMSAQARTFQDHSAIIPLQHVEVQSFTVAKGQRFVALDNVFTGRLPSVIIIGIVDNTAFAGDVLKNPLCFKHYSLENLIVSVNGVQHKIGPLDFATNLNIMGYHHLLKSAGLLNMPDAPIITLDRYRYGYCLFAVDLSAEGTSIGDGTHSSLQPVGNVRVEASFNTALPDAVSFIVYSVKDGGAVEIDKNRSVYVSL